MLKRIMAIGLLVLITSSFVWAQSPDGKRLDRAPRYQDPSPRYREYCDRPSRSIYRDQPPWLSGRYSDRDAMQRSRYGYSCDRDDKTALWVVGGLVVLGLLMNHDNPPAPYAAPVEPNYQYQRQPAHQGIGAPIGATEFDPSPY